MGELARRRTGHPVPVVNGKVLEDAHPIACSTYTRTIMPAGDEPAGELPQHGVSLR